MVSQAKKDTADEQMHFDFIFQKGYGYSVKIVHLSHICPDEETNSQTMGLRIKCRDPMTNVPRRELVARNNNVTLLEFAFGSYYRGHKMKLHILIWALHLLGSR